MKTSKIAALATAFGLLLAASSSYALGDGLPTEAELRREWLGRLDGRHFSARIRLVVAWQDKQEERVVEVWRDDETDGSQERLMARFRDPPDLRGLALLYVENPDRSNDYFVYQPELDRVRRINDRTAREDIYGVDLEYLGFGVAQIEPTDITEIREDRHDGRAVVLVEERAKRKNERFDTRRVWVDPKSWVPLRTQHWRDGRLTLDATTRSVETVDGVATPMHVRFERPLVGEAVEFWVEAIDYRAPIPASHFSALALIKKR